MHLSPVGPEFPPGTDGLTTVDRDDLHPPQAEAIRRMSPERRWEQVVAEIARGVYAMSPRPRVRHGAALMLWLWHNLLFVGRGKPAGGESASVP